MIKIYLPTCVISISKELLNTPVVTTKRYMAFCRKDDFLMNLKLLLSMIPITSSLFINISITQFFLLLAISSHFSSEEQLFLVIIFTVLSENILFLLSGSFWLEYILILKQGYISAPFGTPTTGHALKSHPFVYRRLIYSQIYIWKRP